MLKIEVNLDDIPGEWLGHVMDLLLEAGVNDVFYLPIYMKKNRPGVMMQILAERGKLGEVRSILFQETTTLGIRYFPVSVHRLERRFYKVSTTWGEVSVKEGRYGGEVVQRAPEYEDCRKISAQHNIPLKNVYQEVWSNM
ncbi:nickel insertion protein [Halobacillus naozhouensis]|uniref:DUF111 family protein n=1 Tax=Halobacillus naozhouensis TaxID=554880 RepID=A0ABY8J4N3_9BACI|nr:nickel insertion protein [Halobacillus naozhouensis]WFT77026.1 DUF111 family protein [Halobacillus naozhouensis]